MRSWLTLALTSTLVAATGLALADQDAAALEDVPPEPAPAPDVPEPQNPVAIPETVPDEPRSSRLVIEVALAGGMLHSTVTRAPTPLLDGAPYRFDTGNHTELIAACGEPDTVRGAGECEGLFDPATSGLVGGSLFVGWSVHPRLHLGARGLGAAQLPAGFFVAGGPALSWRAVGPLWIGLSGLVGYEQHDATLVAARGTVPAAYQRAAGGNEIDVPLPAGADPSGAIDGGVIGGASLDLQLTILGASADGLTRVQAAHDLLSGSLLFGASPSLLAGSRGMAFALPFTLGYRFH